MATAATATIRLDGDSAALSRELKKANRNTNRAFREMKADAERLAAGMAVIATAAAAAFSVLVKHSLEASDALAKQADRLNIGTESLKTMQVAASLAGVSQEKLTKSLQKQQTAIYDAATAGGQQALVFTKLGLSLKELQTLSVDQQFQKIAEALNGVENTTVRNALALKIWGARAAEMINFAQESGDSLDELRAGLERTNAAISRFDAAKIEQANDAFELAQTAVEGLGNTLATTLAPIIQGVSEDFLSAAQESNGFRQEAVSALTAVASAAGFTGDAVLGIGLVFKQMAGASLIALGAIQGAITGVARGVEVALVNPILGLIEVLLRMQALIPGPLGRASAEMANIAAATRDASRAAEGWNDSLTKIGAGIEIMRSSFDETLNRELPSAAVDKWVSRVQTASGAVAAAMARTAAVGTFNMDQVAERLKVATAELDRLRKVRLDIETGQAQQHVTGVTAAIRQLQEQIVQTRKTQLALKADPEALIAVREKLNELDIALAESKKRLSDLKVGKVDTSALEREIQLLERRGEALRSSGGGINIPAQVDTAGILRGAATAAAARESLERATSAEIQRIAVSGAESTTAELVRLIESRAALVTAIEERAAAAQAAAGGVESTFEREKQLAKNRVTVAEEAAQQLLKVRQSVVDAGWFIDLKVATDGGGLSGLQAELESTRQQIAEVQQQRIAILAGLSDPSGLQREIDQLKAELAGVEPLAIQADTGALKAAERDIAILSGQLAVLDERRISIVASIPGLAQVEGDIARLQERISEVQAQGLALDTTGATGAAAALEDQLAGLERQLSGLKDQRVTLTADLGPLVDTEERLAGVRKELSQALSARVELAGATEAAGRVADLRKEIAALEDRQLSVRVATSGVEVADRQLKDLQRQLEAVEAVRATLPVDSAALADATAEAGRLRTAIAAVSSKRVTITAAWEGLQAMEPQLARLRGEIDALTTRRLALTADSQEYLEAGSRLQALQAQVSGLEQQRVHLIADLDDVAVQRELTALDAQLTELRGRLANPLQVGGFAVDMGAAVAALEQSSARQKELAQQSAEEIRRIVIGGEQQISQELLNLIEARAQAVAAAQQRQNAFEAALTGNTAVFDQEKVLGAARVQLANEVADQVITARQRMAEGGAVALPTVDPAAIRAQTEQATAQYLSAWQLANEQRRVAETAIQEAVYLSEQEAGAALIELAAQQAREKVLAEFTARGEALDQTGQIADPAARVAFEQQVQNETLAREAEFLNERLALQQQFGAEFVRAQDAIAAVFGQKWARANKTALSNYSAFASAAASIGAVLFANNKKFGIASAIVSTYVGVAKALELPYPANLAAAASVLATGMQQVAAIRSATPGGGGGLGGGIGGAVSIGSSPDFSGDTREQDTRSAVQVIIQGDVLGWDDFVQSRVIDSLRDALDGRDVVIFHGGSRQAQEIRDGS